MSALISAFVQVSIVMLLALCVWLAGGRKHEAFLVWIGLRWPRITNGPLFWRVGLSTAFAGLVLGYALLTLLSNTSGLATARFYGLGLPGLTTAAIYAIVQTALSEELLFRGLIGRRAITAFGFPVGNLLQSSLFGLLHGAMFYGNEGAARAAVYAVFTGALGWMMGYVNERLAGGSIVPGWGIHAAMNLFTSAVMLFGALD